MGRIILGFLLLCGSAAILTFMILAIEPLNRSLQVPATILNIEYFPWYWIEYSAQYPGCTLMTGGNISNDNNNNVSNANATTLRLHAPGDDAAAAAATVDFTATLPSDKKRNIWCFQLGQTGEIETAGMCCYQWPAGLYRGHFLFANRSSVRVAIGGTTTVSNEIVITNRYEHWCDFYNRKDDCVLHPPYDVRACQGVALADLNVSKCIANYIKTIVDDIHDNPLSHISCGEYNCVGKEEASGKHGGWSLFLIMMPRVATFYVVALIFIICAMLGGCLALLCGHSTNLSGPNAAANVPSPPNAPRSNSWAALAYGAAAADNAVVVREPLLQSAAAAAQ